MQQRGDECIWRLAFILGDAILQRVACLSHVHMSFKLSPRNGFRCGQMADGPAHSVEGQVTWEQVSCSELSITEETKAKSNRTENRAAPLIW